MMDVRKDFIFVTPLRGRTSRAGWSDVTLSAGNNSILIYNGDYNAQAPHIDKIEIAAPYSFKISNG